MWGKERERKEWRKERKKYWVEIQFLTSILSERVAIMCIECSLTSSFRIRVFHDGCKWIFSVTMIICACPFVHISNFDVICSQRWLNCSSNGFIVTSCCFCRGINDRYPVPVELKENGCNWLGDLRIWWSCSSKCWKQIFVRCFRMSAKLLVNQKQIC